ncbi:MAG TPA: radical SAM protein [Lachnospiraceae bacterium]|nr:radical SAM protein [Lachnospiraceae bacterium]
MRLDTYGCGCAHNCDYCYARSLLSFRGLWNPVSPRVADLKKIRRRLNNIPAGTIVRLGGMTDCFQLCEKTYKVTYETIREMNSRGIGYLIVTKSDLVADSKYLEILDKELAHIQVTVTSLDDAHAGIYEKACPPSKRIRTILTLQEAGYDVAIRLSPLIPEFMDFEALAQLPVKRGIVEFLRVNAWIRRWLSGVDFERYTCRQGGYCHLPLEDKQEVFKKIRIPELTICEDVTEHYQYWMEHVNPNREDCCNLRKNLPELQIRE